jgi:hypothetical protein
VEQSVRYQADGVSGIVTYTVSCSTRVRQEFEVRFDTLSAIGQHRIMGDSQGQRAQSVITLGRTTFEEGIRDDLNTNFTKKYQNKRDPSSSAVPFAKLLDMAAELAEVPTILAYPKEVVKTELKPLAPAVNP